MNEGSRNLIPFPERTEEEQRRIRSSGGKKSGESRRRKRDQRQLMTTMLKAIPEIDKAAVANLQRLGFHGKGENKDQYTIEAIGAAALLQKVMRGDVKAYRLMLEILGEDGYSQREAERMRHEEAMMEAPAEAGLVDDGFLEMLGETAEGVFEDGPDEPTNTED